MRLHAVGLFCWSCSAVIRSPYCREKINRDLCWGTTGTGTGQTPQEELIRKTWAVMEQVIVPTECSIYSYQPDTDCDPLSNEGKVRGNAFFSPTMLKFCVRVRRSGLSITFSTIRSLSECYFSPARTTSTRSWRMTKTDTQT